MKDTLGWAESAAEGGGIEARITPHHHPHHLDHPGTLVAVWVGLLDAPGTGSHGQMRPDSARARLTSPDGGGVDNSQQSFLAASPLML